MSVATVMKLRESTQIQKGRCLTRKVLWFKRDGHKFGKWDGDQTQGMIFGSPDSKEVKADVYSRECKYCALRQLRMEWYA